MRRRYVTHTTQVRPGVSRPALCGSSGRREGRSAAAPAAAAAGSWPRSLNAAVNDASASGRYSSIRSVTSRIPREADSNSRMLSSIGVDGCIACSRSPIAESREVNSGGFATNDHGSDSSGPGTGSDAAMTQIVASSPVPSQGLRVFQRCAVMAGSQVGRSGGCPQAAARGGCWRMCCEVGFWEDVVPLLYVCRPWER